MRIILLRDVKGVGRKFEEKDVANGYATNFLIPRGLAIALTDQDAKRIAQIKKQEEKKREEEDQKLKESLSKIAGQTITLEIRANDKGHLFEQMTREKLAEIINTDPEQISLEQPIKELGTYKIPVGKTHFTLVLRS